MSNFKSWKDYWRSTSPIVHSYIDQNRDKEIEKFIDDCLGFCAFHFEVFSENEDPMHKALQPFTLIVQDILRACKSHQEQLLLISAAKGLRTIFEIKCNLTFIFGHSNPTTMLARWILFAEYERLVFIRRSKDRLTPEEEMIEESFANEHPYWKHPKNNLLKNDAKWNGENKDLRSICRDIGQLDDYQSTFRVSSKFVHASPLTKNFYLQGPIAKTKDVSIANLKTCYNSLEITKSIYNFLKKPINGSDYDELLVNFLKLKDNVFPNLN